MTTTRPAPARDVTLPWPALLAFGSATLVMVTAEMLPTAVLVPMSRSLGVSEALTGQLVAAWALTVVVASLPLTRLTRRVDRRTLVVAGLVALAASSALTAVAPTYAVALGARLLGAAAVGLLWSTANAHVADLVPDELLGKAVAVVLGGATLGMVLGTPLARVVADLASWRLAFALLAAAALAVALLVLAVVPARERRSGAGTAAGPGRAPVAPMLVVTGLVGLLLVGFYGTYTFITRIGEPASTLLPGGMGTLLLGFGLASATGVALAGRFTGRTTAALVAASTATAVGLLALSAAAHAGPGLATILALGLATGALPPLAQTEILRLAGEERRDLASALIPIVFNGGIAAGASLASVVVAARGPAALPVPAAVVAGIAAVGLAAAAHRRSSTRRSPTGSPGLSCAQTATSAGSTTAITG